MMKKFATLMMSQAHFKVQLKASFTAQSRIYEILKLRNLSLKQGCKAVLKGVHSLKLLVADIGWR